MKKAPSYFEIQDRFLDHPYKLAGRIIDPVRGNLRWKGKLVHLRRKELEVLALLASVDGAIVSRAEFIAAVWGGNDLVGDRGISDKIFLLRRALQDQDEQRPIIRTIPKRGYQLTAPLEQAVLESGSFAGFVPGSEVASSPGWRLERLLNQSERAETWLAHSDEPGSNRRVFRFCRAEAHLRQLRREVTLMRYLGECLGDCEDIAVIRDWQLQDPPYFLARDFTRYGSLHEWASAVGGLAQQSSARRRALMVALARALARLHAVGVVHGQLHAESVLVDSPDDANTSPQLKLSAFALGALIDQQKLASLKITAAGLSFVDGANAPHPTDDLFALGKLLLQLAIGDLAEQPHESSVLRVADPALQALIRSCLGPRTHRPSAAEVADQLTDHAVLSDAKTDDEASTDAVANEGPNSISSAHAEWVDPLAMSASKKSDHQVPRAEKQSPVARATAAGFVGAPEHIGNFRLIDRLGEGGMGTVYLAEQRKPVYRKVALKVIRSGLDGRQILARFDAERQALAMMNHANVATVLESGLSEDGRPFFAMEYVPGFEITTHCDRHQLTVQERIALFLQICDGVMHAHQKGVLHRDLKPSNLLVSYEANQSSVVKIIDFGLAKSLHGKLVSQTLHTSFGAFMGTPVYSSPEQVDGGIAAVDTRSDIYSLGVVLYELLVGMTPIASETLENLEREQLREFIRKSKRLSMRQQLFGAAPKKRIELAELRATTEAALPQILDGDLSWVVSKCIELDPEDRYASVLELKKDLERWLQLRPVEARPTSRWYRFRKLVRRNRAVSLLIAASTSALLISMAAAIAGYVKAERSLQHAQLAEEEASRASDFQVKQIQSLDPQAMGVGLRRSLVKAAESGLADQGSAAVEAGKKQLETLIGTVNFTDLVAAQLEKYYFQPSLTVIESQYGENPGLQAALWQSSANSLAAIGLFESAQAPQTLALAKRAEIFGANDPLTLASLSDQGRLLMQRGKLEEAKRVLDDSINRMRLSSGLNNEAALQATGYRALVNDLLGNTADSESNWREHVNAAANLYGRNDSRTLIQEIRLGERLLLNGKLSEAEALMESAYQRLGPNGASPSKETLEALTSMSELRNRQGRLDEAIAISRSVLRGGESINGADHAGTVVLSANLGRLLTKAFRFDEAQVQLLDALTRTEEVLGEKHLRTFAVQGNLGTLLFAKGDLPQADRYLQLAAQGMSMVTGPNSALSLTGKLRVAKLRLTQGQLKVALGLFEEIIQGCQAAPTRHTRILIEARDGLGLSLLGQKNIIGARAAFVEALKDIDTLNEDKAALLLRVQSHLAQLPFEGVKNPDSISILRSLLEQPAVKASVNVVDRLEATTQLAQALNQRHQFQDALGYSQIALELGNRVFPKGHYLLAFAEIQRGHSLIGLGRSNEARVVLMRAQKQILGTVGLDPRHENQLREVLHGIESR